MRAAFAIQPDVQNAAAAHLRSLFTDEFLTGSCSASDNSRIVGQPEMI